METRPPHDALLAAIVRSSDDAIFSHALDGTVTSWNPAAERLYGDRADEAIGRPLPALFRCSSGSCADLLDKIRRGEPERCEGVHVNKAGVRLDVSMAVSPIRDHSGKPVGASLIARDVSEPKRTEAELQRRAVDLARSNADLQQFAYHASHDLQEPLRNIISFAELLAARYRGRLDDDADDFIEFILDGTSRMRALIRDLLEFSRVARTERILEPVALDRIVEQARTNLAASIDEARAVVKSSTLPIVRGNASELLRVFQNLIGNAVKFRAADRHPAIEISATEGADAWEISFADNGIGIDPRFHERVFEVFRRLHGPEEYAGTGIGLSICRKIVELHGGRIWVESKPGEGATFTLALPKEAPRSLHPTAAPTTD